MAFVRHIFNFVLRSFIGFYYTRTLPHVSVRRNLCTSRSRSGCNVLLLFSIRIGDSTWVHDVHRRQPFQLNAGPSGCMIMTNTMYRDDQHLQHFHVLTW